MTLEVFLKINKNQIYEVLPRIVDWVKINVDGAFVEQTGGAGIDILARDHLRIVCLSAWRVSVPLHFPHRACVEAIHLASQWVHMPVIIESYCSRVVRAFKTSKEDRSRIKEGKDLLQVLQEVEIVQVNHEQKSAENLLAQLARRNMHSAIWLRQVSS